MKAKVVIQRTDRSLRSLQKTEYRDQRIVTYYASANVTKFAPAIISIKKNPRKRKLARRFIRL